MSEFIITMADKETIKNMIKGMHEELIESIIEAEDAMNLGKIRTALEKYYDAFTILRDTILPWLDKFVCCPIRKESEIEKKYIHKGKR